MKVLKTELKEYPLSHVWATKTKHLKFSKSETRGNIKITAAIYNFLVFVCMRLLGHPLITVTFASLLLYKGTCICAQFKKKEKLLLTYK